MDTSGKKTQEISSRIDQIRQYYCNGINVDFAAKIGKDPTYTSQLCTGTKSIGNKIIEKILETFPEVSKTWLYFGEGEMLVSSKRTDKPAAEVPSADTVANLNDYIVLLKDKIASLRDELAAAYRTIGQLEYQLQQEKEKTNSYLAPTPVEATLV